MEDNYVTIEIKKLWNGRAEVRSYQLTEVLRQKRGIKFILDGDVRYVPISDVSKGKAGAVVNAKFPLPNGAKTYRLIGWDWSTLSEDAKEIENQQFLNI